VADGGATRLIHGIPRTFAVIAALALILVAFSPTPGRPFTAHALRVLLVTFVAAPLLLLGLPPGPLRALGARRRSAWMVAVVTAPPTAFFCFTAGLGLALLPPCVAFARRDPLAGAMMQVAWTLTALVAWWCACAPQGAPGRSRDPVAMAHLFLLGVPLQIAAGAVTVADRSLYVGIGLADQRTGGLVLWVPGGLLLWVAITALWVRWARRTAREAAGDDEAPPLHVPGGASS